MRPTRAALLLALSNLLPLSAASPQDRSAGEAGTPAEAPRVFLDCRDHCDFDYLRTEIPFVSYVRDRTVADVHLLVTTRGTGGGGREYTLTFLGMNAFDGDSTTLVYASSQTDTPDETRREIADRMKLGLVRYVSNSPVADRVTISYDASPAEKAAPTQQVDDPWKHWVFETRFEVELEGEESDESVEVSGSLAAVRITEAWKVEIEFDGEYFRSKLDYDDVVNYVNTTRNYSTELRVVKSIGPHWSSGFEASVGTVTRFNQDLSVRIGPAIEYNVYPYAESTRRQFTFQYAVGTSAYDYEEPTIYDKVSERLVEHAFRAGLAVSQPWGSVDGSIEANQYLHDLGKHRIEGGISTEVRLFRGLSLDVFARAARIRDQLYLPKGDLSPEELLVRRRQVATGYRYDLSVGFNYTFGSIYNNVVNPRFDGGGFF